jgi:hypothetical protein
MAVRPTSEICGQCGFALVKNVSKATRAAQAQQNAVTSLVLGIVGLFVPLLPLVTTIHLVLFLVLGLVPAFAIVIGNRTAKSLPVGSAQAGLAKAGTVLGWIGAGAIVVWMLALVAQAGS